DRVLHEVADLLDLAGKLNADGVERIGIARIVTNAARGRRLVIKPSAVERLDICLVGNRMPAGPQEKLLNVGDRLAVAEADHDAIVIRIYADGFPRAVLAPAAVVAELVFVRVDLEIGRTDLRRVFQGGLPPLPALDDCDLGDFSCVHEIHAA